MAEQTNDKLWNPSWFGPLPGNEDLDARHRNATI